MAVTVVTGDIVNDVIPEEFIVHQINALTVSNPAGLAAALYKKYPEANVYSERRALGGRNLAVVADRPQLGSILVRGKIINLVGQHAPGKSGMWYKDVRPKVEDDARTRLRAFESGLANIAVLQPKSIAFPWHVGCGMAGGSWKDYSAAIKDFAVRLPRCKVVIYRPTHAL